MLDIYIPSSSLIGKHKMFLKVINTFTVSVWDHLKDAVTKYIMSPKN